MDRILIPAIPLQARVGITEEERSAPQELRIGLALHVDLARAGASDDLGDTVDYDRVCATVSEVVGQRPFHLIEAVADVVATAVLQGFGVAEVEVRVEKPAALRARGVPYAGVEIRRARDA